ncbi:hypothetical protein SFC50_07030 [Bacillus infantis]|uniref:hypothetical protein n=1 Tax=Bacillus infantis TaxID=324767 RepID=UPI003982661B
MWSMLKLMQPPIGNRVPVMLPQTKGLPDILFWANREPDPQFGDGLLQKKPAAALQDLFEWKGKVNFLFSSGFSIDG